MDLANILNPTPNKYECAKGNEVIKNALIGSMKSWVRGGIIGGVIGGAIDSISGNSDFINYGTYMGALTDVAQNCVRSCYFVLNYDKGQEEFLENFEKVKQNLENN